MLISDSKNIFLSSKKMIEQWEFLESLALLKDKKEKCLSIKIELIEQLLEFGFLQESVNIYNGSLDNEIVFYTLHKSSGFEFLRKISDKNCILDLKNIELYKKIITDDFSGVEIYLKKIFENDIFFDLKSSEKYIFSFCVNYLFSGDKDVSDYMAERFLYNCVKYGKYSSTAKYSALKIIKFYSRKKVLDFFSFSGKRNDLITSINKFLFQFGDPFGRVYTEFSSLVRKSTNLNSVVLGNSQPRVAVCISGVFKVSLEQLKSIQEMIVAPLDADVFLHTWDDYQLWAGTARKGDRFWELNFEELNIEIPTEMKSLSSFCANFPNTSEVMYSDVSKKLDRREIYSIIKPEECYIENVSDFIKDNLAIQDNYKFQGKLNQVFMFYGMYRCFELMLKYEELNNFRYDYVIRIRPDNIIFDPVDFEKLKKLNTNEVAVNIYSHGIADDMFYAERNTYEKMISIWERIRNKNGINIFPNIQNFHAHNFLYLWMLESGLIAKKFEVNRTYKQSYRFAKIPNLMAALENDLSNFTGSEKFIVSNKKFIDFLYSLSE